MSTLNGVTFSDQNPISVSLELDARCQVEYLAVCSVCPIPLGYLDFKIAHLEMLNILAALKVWHLQWVNKKSQLIMRQWCIF